MLSYEPILQYSNTPLLHSYCAALLRDVFLKLFAILFYKRRRRHCRRVAKGTDGITHDVTADVENQTEIVLVAFALLNAAENLSPSSDSLRGTGCIDRRTHGRKTAQGSTRPEPCRWYRPSR